MVLVFDMLIQEFGFATCNFKLTRSYAISTHKSPYHVLIIFNKNNRSEGNVLNPKDKKQKKRFKFLYLITNNKNSLLKNLLNRSVVASPTRSAQ